MRMLDRLAGTIRDAATYNPEAQAAAPVCILWPDHDRQWEPAIFRLQNEMPELFVLGDYAPEKRIGPAIWLRCIVSGAITPDKKDDAPPSGEDRAAIPIIYLPGSYFLQKYRSRYKMLFTRSSIV